MKYPVSILLFLLMGLQTFSKLFVILGYEWNKDYIAKNLCINRNRPQCHCHGKCFLNKKLNLENNAQSYPGERAQKDISQLQFFSNSQIIVNIPAMVFIDKIAGDHTSLIPRDISESFFQPPRA